jgi:hypothetical protein
MKYLLLSTFLLSLLATGCSSSQITHSWKATTGVTTNFKKILVVGINGPTETGTRDRMEQHLVGDLRNLGYSAVASLEEYGPKAFRNMDEEQVLDKVQKSGFDAVITIVLLDKAKERHYVPGRIYFSPYIVYHRRFWGYYATMHERIYTPGYYSVNTKYFWESNLYDLSSKELLYSVQTESFDPGNADNLAHEYGKLIVWDMVRKEVLHKKQGLAKITTEPIKD